MNKIFDSLGRKEIKDISLKEIRNSDIVLDLKKGLMGIILGDDILFYDYKRILSFRVKIQNTFYYNLKLKKYKKGINKEKLKKYFIENKDNPYALRLSFGMINAGEDINNMVQFPPLKIEKNLDNFNNLISKSKEGDLIFTFEKNSNISKIIRKNGRCQWSHTGTLLENKEIFEMTTEGFSSSRNLKTLDWSKYYIAIYRSKFRINKKMFRESIERNSKMKVKYGWRKVFLIATGNKFNKRLTKAITINNLIDSNHFKLVGYS